MKYRIAFGWFALVALAWCQDPQPDPQSLAAVRASVTRLSREVDALTARLKTLTASTDSRFAGLTTALVPVGAVIDWYSPQPGTPVPEGFMICNGELVQDAQSPFNGKNVPNLIDKFVMGVTRANLGATGGKAEIPSGGGHGHGIRFSGYAWGEINYARGPGRQDQFQMQYAADAVGNHDHGGENRPPYFGLIKLIRIK